jgi:hypothetical protein
MHRTLGAGDSVGVRGNTLSCCGKARKGREHSGCSPHQAGYVRCTRSPTVQVGYGDQ